jgi:circadian clock protein KaiC
MDADRLSLEQIDPMQYLADEFANKVYQDVTTNQTRLVVFDSIAGFQLTLMEESVRTRLHALAKSLSRMNVSVLLINETSAMHGEAGISEKGISYLADNVIALSYDPADDSRATITVAKKRLSDFERRPHKFVIGPNKVQAIAI